MSDHFDEEPDGDPHGECVLEINRLKAECERLRAALKQANSKLTKANLNHEEFERKWYLSQDECDKITELNHGQWLALENIRTLAARNRTEEWAGHVIRWCAEAGAVHQALRDVAIDAARAKP